MSIAPKQIGWSQESNLLWEISKLLDLIQGQVGGLQGAITLTTTGNSGPATFINNILNVPEYTIEGLGGVPNSRTITINGSTQSLANDVSFTILGTPISVVPNYSALPAPNTVPGAFYWVENSQGAYWLPGNIGGTFYNAGLYYSNGTRWEFMETPWQAVQAEVDLGVNFTKFVTPLTFDSAAKWNTKQGNITLTTTGTSGPATFIGNVLNVPNYAGVVYSVFTPTTDGLVPHPITVSGRILSDNGTWITPSTGITNLAYVASPTQGTVTSSTGTSAIITLAGATNAGLLAPSDFTKLQGLSNAVFTTTVNGLVPAPGTATGKVLSDNGVWLTPNQVAAGGQTEYFTWKFSTVTTASDPGNGFFRINNASGQLATQLYINDLTSNNQIDISNIFARVGGEWLIFIQQRNQADKWIQYTTTTAYTDNTGWWTIPVVFDQVGPGGAIASNADCLFVFINKNASSSSLVQIVITSAVGISNITTDANGVGQNGRNVIIDNGAASINYTINGPLTTSFVKHGLGIITFVQGAGRTMVQVDGTAQLSGALGSSATIASVGTVDYLRISNA